MKKAQELDTIPKKGNFAHNAADISKYRLVLGNVHCYRLLLYITKDLYKRNDITSLTYDFKELVTATGLEKYKPVEASKKLAQTLSLLKKPVLYYEEEEVDGVFTSKWCDDQLVYRHEKTKDDKVTILISKICIDILNCLDGYTSIDLETLSKLETNQQSYLYLLLKSYEKSNKKERVFSLDEFLMIMGAENVNSYNKEKNSSYTTNIKRRLIGIDVNGDYTKDKNGKPFGNVYQINKNTDLDVTPSMEKNSKGEYIVKFKIKSKEENILIESPEKKMFNEMMKMISESMNIDLFNKYLSEIKFHKFDKVKNKVTFTVPSVEYAKNIEENQIVFIFYRTAFDTVFKKDNKNLELMYKLRDKE